MLKFLRLRRTPSPPDSSENAEVLCPFLARTIADGKTPMCLSRQEPIAISRRYVQSYCATAQHMRCSLFLSANHTTQGAAQPEAPIPDIQVETIHATISIDSPMPAETAALVPAGPVTDAETATADTSVATRPELELNTRQDIVAASSLLTSVVESLATRVRANEAALSAIALSIEDAKARSVLPSGFVLETIDDEAVQEATDAAHRIAHNPDSLTAYMTVARCAPEIISMASALRGMMMSGDGLRS